MSQGPNPFRDIVDRTLNQRSDLVRRRTEAPQPVNPFTRIVESTLNPEPRGSPEAPRGNGLPIGLLPGDARATGARPVQSGPPERNLAQLAVASVGRGAIGTAADLVSAGAAGVGQLERVTGRTQLGSFVRRTAQESQEGAERLIGDMDLERTPAGRFSPSGIIQTLGETLPQVTGAVGAGVATGGGSLPLSIAAFSASSAAPVVGSTYADALQELEQLDPGNPENQRRAENEAVIAGGITGITSVIPGIAILRKVPGGDQLLRAAVTRTAGRLGAAAVAEGTQEYTEGVLQEMLTEVYRRDETLSASDITKIATHPDRALEALVGGIMGGGVRATLEASGIVDPQAEIDEVMRKTGPKLTPQQEAENAKAEAVHVPAAIDTLVGPEVEPTDQAVSEQSGQIDAVAKINEHVQALKTIDTEGKTGEEIDAEVIEILAANEPEITIDRPAAPVTPEQLTEAAGQATPVSLGARLASPDGATDFVENSLGLTNDRMRSEGYKSKTPRQLAKKISRAHRKALQSGEGTWPTRAGAEKLTDTHRATRISHKTDAERGALHDQIVEQMVTQPLDPDEQNYKLGHGGMMPSKPRQDRVAVILTGPPAAGKSTYAINLAENTGAAIVDSDLIKPTLPEASQGAAFVHNESGNIRYRVMDRLSEDGTNLIVPIVGAIPNQLAFTRESLEELGYEVHLVTIHLDKDETTRRALRRFDQIDRYVALDYVFEQIGNQPVETYHTEKEGFASASLYNNDTAPDQLPQSIEIAETGPSIEPGRAFAVSDEVRGDGGRGRRGPVDAGRVEASEAGPAEQAVPTARPEQSPEAPEEIAEAAIQTADGQIFTGATHGHALIAAQDAGAIQENEDGSPNLEGVDLDLFKTNRGRFVDRIDAATMFQIFKAEDIAGAEQPDTGQPNRGEAFAKRQKQLQPETKSGENLQSLTADQLRAQAREAGLPTSGTKSKLVERLAARKPTDAVTVEEIERNPPKTLKSGRKGTLRLAGDKTVPLSYAVVEADELQASHLPGKGFAINPRGDRNERPYHDPDEGKGPRGTVQKIAENPLPDLLLTDTPTPVDGPPIVSPNENAELAVLGGNARTMGIQLAYERGNAGAYQQGLIDAAERFGLDKDQVSNMSRPVLVRLLSEEDAGNRGEISRLLNEGLTTGRTETADAVSRAERLADSLGEIARALTTFDTLRSALNSPAAARRIVRAFVDSGAFTDRDLQEMTDENGLPNTRGKAVIEQTILATAVPDLAALSAATPSAKQILLRAAPALVQIRRMASEASGKAAGYAFDRTMGLALEAIGAFKSSPEVTRGTREQFREWASGDQTALGFVEEDFRNDRQALAVAASLMFDSPTRAADKIRSYAQHAEDAATGQLGLLTGGEPLSGTEAFWDLWSDPVDSPMNETLKGEAGAVTLYSNPAGAIFNLVFETAAVTEDALNKLAVKLGSGVNKSVRALISAAGTLTPIGKMNAALVQWLTDSDLGRATIAITKLARDQFVPLSMIAPEAAAAIKEARIKDSFGRLVGIEFGRLLSGTARRSKVLGFTLPRKIATKANRELMFQALTDEKFDVETLPSELIPLVRAARKTITRLGQAAVDAGLLQQETFDRNKLSYLPRLYRKNEQDKLGLRGVSRRFAIIGDRFKPRLSDAWAILDTRGRPINRGPNQTFRYDSKEDRDIAFEKIVSVKLLEWVNTAQKAGTVFWKTKDTPSRQISVKAPPAIVDADLYGPRFDALPEPLQLAIEGVRAKIANEYTLNDPLDEATLHAKGLIEEAGYPVAKAIIQLNHDIQMATLFNGINADLTMVANDPTPGMTQMPNDARFGKLKGKYVNDSVARELNELAAAPGIALEIYDAFLRLWKRGKTVYNPATHGRNIVGNFMFADLAGIPVWDPTNLPWFARAVASLRARNPQSQAMFRELNELGVIGADIVSQEMASMLDAVDTDGILNGSKPYDWVIKLATLAPIRRTAGTLYRVEDEIFKVASYLKQRDKGMSPTDAAKHVRRWFPYYDQIPNSMLIRNLARRGFMPFASFYYESLRIGANGLREKPVTMAKLASIPSLMTVVGLTMLGIDDDDWDSVKKDMRGKFGGWPIWSAIMPFRDDEGRLVQWDLTNIVPYADLIGKRIDRGDREPHWTQVFWRKILLGNPVTNIGVGLATNQDPFFGRRLFHTGMSEAEKSAEAAKFVGKTLVPPLTPIIGQSWRALDTSRIPKGTLQKRNTTQVRLRSLAGVDLRFAGPNLYRVIDEYLVEQDIPEAPTMGDSTPRSRARGRLYDAIIQRDEQSLAEAMIDLEDLGQPQRSLVLLRRSVKSRHPLRRVPTKLRFRFLAQLTAEERRSVDRTLKEYEAVLSDMAGLFRAAVKIVREERPTVAPTETGE